MRTISMTALLVIAGCTHTIEDKIGDKAIDRDLTNIARSGYSAVVPNTALRVGRLYFSGNGKRPAFATADGTVFNHLCYDDFAQTGALSEIDKHVVDEGISVTKKTIVGSLTGSAAVSLSKFKNLGTLAIGADGSKNRTYVVEKVHTFTLTDEGMNVLKDGIGAGCRNEIADLAKDRQVIVALSAQRAEKATDTSAMGINGEIGASMGGAVTSKDSKVTVTGQGLGFGGGVSRSVTDEYELVYFSVKKSGL